MLYLRNLASFVHNVASFPTFHKETQSLVFIILVQYCKVSNGHVDTKLLVVEICHIYFVEKNDILHRHV